MEPDNAIQALCESCAKITNKDDAIDCSREENEVKSESEDSIEKCKHWLLEKCSLSDLNSEVSSSQISVSSESQGQVEEFCEEDISKRDEFGTHHGPNSYGDVKVYNSQHVIVGNVTYITGPVHITQTSSTVHQQQTINQVFLEGSAITQRNQRLRIVTRLHWLAQPAFSKTPLQKLVRYVIIAHTGTEEGHTQSENTLLVRLVQSFDIESRKLNDISYNFLVGSDGNVYQGRGWNLQGEHTSGYDDNSIAIAFVGCFVDHLPPLPAINAAKALIQHGIELGIIPKDYILLGQNQCLPIESPGRKLFEEIKTWPQWTELIASDR